MTTSTNEQEAAAHAGRAAGQAADAAVSSLHVSARESLSGLEEAVKKARQLAADAERVARDAERSKRRQEDAIESKAASLYSSLFGKVFEPAAKVFSERVPADKGFGKFRERGEPK